MFGVDQADPDASNFQSNYDDFDYAENRLVTDQKLQEHHLRLDDLPLAVDLDDDECGLKRGGPTPRPRDQQRLREPAHAPAALALVVSTARFQSLGEAHRAPPALAP